MRRRLITPILAALVLLAGCGDDGNSSKARTDYTQKMQEIQQDPGGKTAALGEAMADPRLGDKRWRRAADLWLQEQRRALQELRRTRAPRDVSQLHLRYVSETAQWLAAMEELVRSIQRGDISRDQLERRASERGNRYAEQVGPIASEIESKGYDAFRPFDSSS
jgi:hypothetical protein